MPGYPAHLFVGTICFAPLWIYIVPFFHTSALSHRLFFISFITMLFGSLFPDIDTKSMIQIKLYQVLLLFSLFCLAIPQKQSLLFFTPLSLIPLTVNHRGITHKPWFLLLCTVCGMLIAHLVYNVQHQTILLLGFFFFAGTISHLALDFRYKLWK